MVQNVITMSESQSPLLFFRVFAQLTVVFGEDVCSTALSSLPWFEPLYPGDLGRWAGIRWGGYRGWAGSAPSGGVEGAFLALLRPHFLLTYFDSSFVILSLTEINIPHHNLTRIQDGSGYRPEVSSLMVRS